MVCSRIIVLHSGTLFDLLQTSIYVVFVLYLPQPLQIPLSHFCPEICDGAEFETTPFVRQNHRCTVKKTHLADECSTQRVVNR